jgi:multiple sugar transport system permease protein
MTTAPADVATLQPSLVERFTILRNKKVFGWTLMGPCLLFLLLVGLYPTLYVFALSFSKFIPGEGMEFVGLQNYIRTLLSPRFWHGLLVTAWFAIFGVGVQLLIGFALALALQAIDSRPRKIITTLFLIPFMITPAVVAVLWRLIYHPSVGPLNATLAMFGIEGPAWVTSDYALGALVVADIWQWTPFMTILLLAGLQSLSQEVYEAAYVDGATAWQAFKDMTLPQMKPFIFLAVFLRFIDAFKLFDLVFVITHGGPGDVTESISYFTYVIGFKYFDLGMAAAMSVLQLIIIIVAGKILLSQLSRVEETTRSAP